MQSRKLRIRETMKRSGRFTMFIQYYLLDCGWVGMPNAAEGNFNSTLAWFRYHWSLLDS